MFLFVWLNLFFMRHPDTVLELMERPDSTTQLQERRAYLYETREVSEACENQVGLSFLGLFVINVRTNLFHKKLMEASGITPDNVGDFVKQTKANVGEELAQKFGISDNELAMLQSHVTAFFNGPAVIAEMDKNPENVENYLLFPFDEALRMAVRYLEDENRTKLAIAKKEITFFELFAHHYVSALSVAFLENDARVHEIDFSICQDDAEEKALHYLAAALNLSQNDVFELRKKTMDALVN